MPPSKLIVDFNRCFEPSPFNTGPPIPRPYHQNVPDIVPIDTSIHSQTSGTYLPDLTSSPASSCGSSLHSLSLEDEEIKKIFAPQTENSRIDVSQSFHDVYVPIHEEEIYSFTSKEHLNPRAAPFIPSSDRSTPPPKLVGVDPAVQPSPLDLGFEPINFADPTLAAAQDQSPDPRYSPHRECIPLPPRSARFQYPRLPDADEQEPLTAIGGPPQSSSAYLPLLTEALHPDTPDRLRKVLAHAIVNGCPTNWDLQAFFDLGKHLTQEACKPGPENGSSVFPCDSARYKLGDEESRQGSSSGPEIAVADLSLHLYNHFMSLSDEMGQAFSWNLRESILQKFIGYWDSKSLIAIEFKSGINFENQPTIDNVRSALALCQSIGALFTRNLITRNHISMCISVLMKDLVSVEHLEALGNLILSSGPTLWTPTSADTISEHELRSDQDELPLADRGLLLSSRIDPTLRSLYQNSHVTVFLSGLMANVFGRSLNGGESVVNMGWAKGKFAARIGEVVNSVKEWESATLSEHFVASGLIPSLSSTNEQC